jgi:hypothetical protein
MAMNTTQQIVSKTFCAPQAVREALRVAAAVKTPPHAGPGTPHRGWCAAQPWIERGASLAGGAAWHGGLGTFFMIVNHMHTLLIATMRSIETFV